MGIESKVSKKQRSLDVSKDLLHASTEVNELEYDLPILMTKKIIREKQGKLEKLFTTVN